jgi:hypothetical protein
LLLTRIPGISLKLLNTVVWLMLKPEQSVMLMENEVFYLVETIFINALQL